MSINSQNIEDLIILCKQKNQKAQFEVYNRYSKAMYNVAYRIVKDEHFAQDVMQEAFLKAFTKIDTFKEEVTFGAWLKKIVINYSIDFYKKNNRFQLEDLSTTVQKVEDDASFFIDNLDLDSLQISNVFDSILNLKDNYRMVLTLFYIEGYDHEEISEILKITNANCRTTLNRAKNTLRKKLEELDRITKPCF